MEASEYGSRTPKELGNSCCFFNVNIDGGIIKRNGEICDSNDICIDIRIICY